MKNIFSTLVDTSPLPNTPSTDFTNVLNIAFAIAGAVAFMMLVIAGFRYTVSQGDPTRIADAKRMIIYTIVGIIVISLAATIVNFVLGKV